MERTLVPLAEIAHPKRYAELAEAYAGKYVNETDADPTDDEQARIFTRCVVPAPAILYPAIRSAVYRWRKENGRTSRLGDI